MQRSQSSKERKQERSGTDASYLAAANDKSQPLCYWMYLSTLSPIIMCKHASNWLQANVSQNQSADHQQSWRCADKNIWVNLTSNIQNEKHLKSWEATILMLLLQTHTHSWPTVKNICTAANKVTRDDQKSQTFCTMYFHLLAKLNLGIELSVLLQFRKNETLHLYWF